MLSTQILGSKDAPAILAEGLTWLTTDRLCGSKQSKRLIKSPLLPSDIEVPMSESNLDDLKEISDRFDELGDALEKFLRSRSNEQGLLSDTQRQTMTDIQREFAATFQEGRDAIQTAMRDADTTAARRLDAIINALNSRLSATQASVLIAAEKARESLQSAEGSVINSAKNLEVLCRELKDISKRLTSSVEAKDKSILVLSKEILFVTRLQKQLRFLIVLNVLLLAGIGIMFLMGGR